jgi:hypothetical protein
MKLCDIVESIYTTRNISEKDIIDTVEYLITNAKNEKTVITIAKIAKEQADYEKAPVS